MYQFLVATSVMRAPNLRKIHWTRLLSAVVEREQIDAEEHDVRITTTVVA